MAAITSTPESSESISSDGFRLTACLECGHFVHGKPTEISFHFSEDHMCAGCSSKSDRNQLFKECILILANRAYGSNAFSFDIIQIKSALDDIFSKRNDAQEHVDQDSSMVHDYGSRLTVCFDCGHFHYGKHADASFQFSEEHICEEGSSTSNRRQPFMECIALLADIIYYDKAIACGPDASPFDVRTIQSTLDEIVLRQVQVPVDAPD